MASVRSATDELTIFNLPTVVVPHLCNNAVEYLLSSLLREGRQQYMLHDQLEDFVSKPNGSLFPVANL